MDNYTVFSSARGGGKSSWIISQLAGRIATDDTVRRYAILVPNWRHARIFEDHHVPVETFTESTIDSMRGMRFEHVYVDNADLFSDDPLDILQRVAPGTPATLTYTPLSENISSLPGPTPETEPHIEFSEDDLMLAYMLAYIRKHADD
jgi:hypothetical protein